MVHENISDSTSQNSVSEVPARFIGYARCSSRDQNADLQRDALQRAGCETIYEESVSGTAATRPQLERCLEDLRAGDILVVWKLDRLGRSLIDLLQIVKSLEDRGIQFRSLSDAIDTTTPAGRLFFHIAGAFAEYERCQIRERVRAGIAAARRRGSRLGRRPALTSTAVEHARRLLSEGEPPRTVARTLRCSVATLYRRLAETRGLMP